MSGFARLTPRLCMAVFDACQHGSTRKKATAFLTNEDEPPCRILAQNALCTQNGAESPTSNSARPMRRPTPASAAGWEGYRTFQQPKSKHSYAGHSENSLVLRTCRLSASKDHNVPVSLFKASVLAWMPAQSRAVLGLF